jgi:hypothetical protein
VNQDIAVKGKAVEDENYQGGGDTIQYEVELSNAEGPFTVSVELLYQPISYRWAKNLHSYNGAEISRFIQYFDSIPHVPTVISTIMEVIE